MKKESCAAIILAAGSGKRMNSQVKKQYMKICGRPLLFYSIQAMEKFGLEQIVLVTGKEDMEFCKKEIVEHYGFSHVTAIVPGGKERYDSVYEGLKAVKDCEYVLIHDGARPCLDNEILSAGLREAKKYGASATAVPLKDTIKIADEQGFVESTPDRSLLWSVQTPQTFQYDIIRNAYEKMYETRDPGLTITDDAMVVENFSDKKVKLVMGSYRNIKVTTPEDLSLMENAYLK